MQKSHVWIWGAVLVFTLAVIALAWRPAGRYSEPEATTNKSQLDVRLASSSGSVLVQRGSETRSATVNETLQAGDVITTGADGHASIEFFAGDRTALDVNSSITIKTADIDAANWRKQRVQIQLEGGRIWSRALKLLDPSSRYQVIAGSVVTDVRGTAWSELWTNNRQVLRFDEFDGSIALSGGIAGTLDAGLSALMGTPGLPASFADTMTFTPDEVRNDPWIRQQLRDDRVFAARALDVRKSLGETEEIGLIGEEAGPYTLDQGTHSGYTRIEITSKDPKATFVTGASVPLVANAIFELPGGKTQKDVTTLATWQVLDPTLATIDADGVLHIKTSSSTMVDVHARWNDGTHEHSGSARFPVNATATINTSATFQIKTGL